MISLYFVRRKILKISSRNLKLKIHAKRGEFSNFQTAWLFYGFRQRHKEHFCDSLYSEKTKLTDNTFKVLHFYFDTSPSSSLFLFFIWNLLLLEGHGEEDEISCCVLLKNNNECTCVWHLLVSYFVFELLYLQYSRKQFEKLVFIRHFHFFRYHQVREHANV